MYMKCKHCGFDNPETNTSCAECGKTLEEIRCNKCNSPLTTLDATCQACGTVNPYFEDDTHAEGTITSEVKGQTNALLISVSPLTQRIVTFVTLVVVLLISLLLTFGPITTTSASAWNPETMTVTNTTEWEYVTFTYDQSSIQMYRGYFTNVFNEQDIVIEHYHDLAEDHFDEVDNTLDADDYDDLFSSFDSYGLQITTAYPSVSFYNLLPLFMEIIFLMIVQVTPLIILGILTVRFIKRKSLGHTQHLFLLAGIFGILLMLFLTNQGSDYTRPGVGLIIYTVLMFLTFITMVIVKNIRNKSFVKPQIILYTANALLGFLLIIFATSAFLRVGYEYEQDTFAEGSIPVRDLNFFTTVFSDDFEFVNPPTYISALEGIFSDEDLHTNEDNIEYATNNFNHVTFLGIELFESKTMQIVLTFIIASFSILTLILVSVHQYLLMTNHKNRFKVSLLIIQSIMAALIISLFVLSIFYRNELNSAFRDHSSYFTVQVNLWLIVALFIIVILAILNLLRFKAKQV